MFLPDFDVLCDLTEQTHGNIESIVLYNKETNYYSYSILKSFNITRKQAFAKFGQHEKSHLT